MMLGKNDQMGKKEAVDSHDSQERPGKASLWARMKEKTVMALAVVGMTAAIGVGCEFHAAGLDPLPDGSTEDATIDKDGSIDAKDGGDLKDSGPGLDGADLDSGNDSGSDLDSGHDGGDMNDAGPDSGLDAGEPDGSVVDAGEDAGLDAGVDAGTDAGTPDSGPTLCPSVSIGTYHGYIPKNTSHNVAGYSIKYKGETVPGSFIAIVDIACNANGTPITTLNCPEGVATPMPTLTAEGKQITITPYDVGAATMGTDVKVE